MAGNGAITNPLYQLNNAASVDGGYLLTDVDSPDADALSETLSEAGSTFGFADVQKSPRPSIDEPHTSPRPSMDAATNECGYVSGRGHCRSKRAGGLMRCKFHGCPTKGCGNDKDSKAKTCGNCPKLATARPPSFISARAKLKKRSAETSAKPASTIDALLAAESGGVGNGQPKNRFAAAAAGKGKAAAVGKGKPKGPARKPASTVDTDALLAAASDGESSDDSEVNFGFSEDDLAGL